MVHHAAIESIKGRLAAIAGGTEDWTAEFAIDTSSIEAEREARPVWYVACGNGVDGVPIFVAETVRDRPTAEFIAAAPTDIQMLLDIVDELLQGRDN